MSSVIPKLRKKISSYLIEEDGRITKQSLLSLGAIVTGAALGAALQSKEAKAVDLTAHEHSHLSHSSHSSY